MESESWLNTIACIDKCNHVIRSFCIKTAWEGWICGEGNGPLFILLYCMKRRLICNEDLLLFQLLISYNDSGCFSLIKNTNTNIFKKGTDKQVFCWSWLTQRLGVIGSSVHGKSGETIDIFLSTKLLITFDEVAFIPTAWYQTAWCLTLQLAILNSRIANIPVDVCSSEIIADERGLC